MPFNKSKPYGEVCGLGISYKFVQNNKFYDHHFNEVTKKGEPVPGGEYDVIEVRKPAPVVEKAPEPKEFTGMAVDQPIQTGDDSVDVTIISGEAEIIAPEDDGLSELTRKELFEQLERMGADKPEQNARKDDLVAMLRDELKAKDAEDDE